MTKENQEKVDNAAEILSVDKKSNNGSLAEGIELKELDPADLIVKREYANLYPMPEPEFQKLKESIESEGQRVPVPINQRNELIDGHGRMRACRELGKKVLVEVRHFESLEEEKKLIHILNLTRRQLSEYARIKAVVIDEDFIREQAHKRRISHLRRGSTTPLVLDRTDGGVGRAEQICSHHAGVSLDRYRRVRALIKRNAISDKIELDLLEDKIKLEKVLKLLEPKETTQSKKTRQFQGETQLISPNVRLICGRFQDVNPVHIGEGGFSLIFPTFDFSYKQKLAKDIAAFASRFLDKTGYLVLYARQDSLGQVFDVVTKAAKDLQLLFVLPVTFPEEWENVIDYIVTNTVMYMIFGKKGYDENRSPMPGSGFDEPVSIELPSTGEIHTEELGPELTNAFTVDHLIRGLYLDTDILPKANLRPHPENVRICDPLSGNGNGDVAIKLIERGYQVVAIEPDKKKFEALRDRVERQMKSKDLPSSDSR
jgi:ParB-like chromosome segregation protein Spo0J